MKLSKNVINLLFSLFLLAVPAIQATDVPTYVVSMKKEKNSPPDQPKVGVGHRSPTRLISCIIDMNDGVSIAPLNSSEIELYEIYDINNNLIGSYLTEEDFINQLFILSGDVTIQFVSQDFTLTGEVNLGN